ncbi:50S ribosomal protein L38e [Candidatus Bathyarchaeota archaeon]|nr:50S ribosomal protein L38e [Candidatus Bathyarchaeota archaeon]
MPKEIFNTEEFQKLSEKATECIIKKQGETTKIKLKTSRYLYTIKLDSKAADSLLNKINCPKTEI